MASVMRRSNVLVIAILSAGALFLRPASAPPAALYEPPASADRGLYFHPYGRLYQSIVDRGVKAGLVGLAVLIATPEEGTWIGTGGYADLETGARIQPGSVFYSSSAVKLFTSTAVMMLRDAGLIDLDAPVDRYLPGDMSGRIANASAAKVRNLLNHTSGIPDYDMDVYTGNDPLGITWREEIESIYGKKADFQPGSEFRYANINFKLLAVIVDHITGDHADFLNQRIFQPLGMRRTYYRKEAGLPRPPGLVTPYFDRYADGSLESAGAYAPEVRQNHAYGDDGLLADVGDYARFLQALFAGALVSPEALRMMSTPEGPSSLYGYGLGMTVARTEAVDEIKYGRACGHGGRAPYGILDLIHYPKSGVTIVIASNYGYAKSQTPATKMFDELADVIADAVFNQRVPAAPPDAPSPRAPRPGSAESIRKVVREDREGR